VRATARIVVAGACLVGLFTPAPAYALWGGGWLERLSGPGPFSGWVVNPRFLCVSAPMEGNERAAARDNLGRHEWSRRLIYPSDAEARIYASAIGCGFLHAEQPRLEVGLERGWMNSTDNVLDYSNFPLSDEDKEVKLRTLMITADMRINRVLDVGMAIGRASFSPGSDHALFNDFSRTVSQPLRVAARPLTAFSKDRRAEALVIRFDATKFHGGFTAEDFGANPGSYNEPGEIVWGWSIRVDPLALLWR
jgi:hypothetical protein